MTEPAILAGSPLFYALLVTIGLAVGTYGTLVGLGGGVILLPILLILFPGAPPEILTSISLSVVFLNAASGTIAYARQGRIDYHSGILFALATIPGTIIGVWLLKFLEARTFNTIFGTLLIIASLFLLSRPRTNGLATNEASTTSERSGSSRHQVRQVLGSGLSFAVGFIAGLLGIGGGVIHVPMMIYILRFPVHVATATSHFILVFTALSGVLTHLALGAGFGNWQVVLFIALGIIPGAQLGALLSRRLRTTLIVRLLALALIVLGLRLLLG